MVSPEPAEGQAAQHTPGPWTVDNGDSLIWGVFADDANAVCYLGEPTLHGGFSPLREEDEANAHLIAAAPDFYDACLGTDPESSRLETLGALIWVLDTTEWAEALFNSPGTRDRLAQIRAFHADLCAAFQVATEGRSNA